MRTVELETYHRKGPPCVCLHEVVMYLRKRQHDVRAAVERRPSVVQRRKCERTRNVHSTYSYRTTLREGAPLFAGALIAGMVHAKRELGGDGDGDQGIEDDIARDLNPTWWPFLLLSVGGAEVQVTRHVSAQLEA